MSFFFDLFQKCELEATRVILKKEKQSLSDTFYDEWQNNISDKQVDGVC